MGIQSPLKACIGPGHTGSHIVQLAYKHETKKQNKNLLSTTRARTVIFLQYDMYSITVLGERYCTSTVCITRYDLSIAS